MLEYQRLERREQHTECTPEEGAYTKRKHQYVNARGLKTRQTRHRARYAKCVYARRKQRRGCILNGSLFVWPTIRIQPQLVHANRLLDGHRFEELDALIGGSLGGLRCLWRGPVEVGRVCLWDRDRREGCLRFLRGLGHDGLTRQRGWGEEEKTTRRGGRTRFIDVLDAGTLLH